MNGANATTALASPPKQHGATPKSDHPGSRHGSFGAKRASQPMQQAQAPTSQLRLPCARGSGVVAQAPAAQNQGKSLAARAVGGMPLAKQAPPELKEPSALKGRALSRGTTQAPQSPDTAGPEPSDVAWSSVLRNWKACLRRAVKSGDVYAVHAYGTAVNAISREADRAYRSFKPDPVASFRVEPEEAYAFLHRLMVKGGASRKQVAHRRELASELSRLDDLLRSKDAELARRARQLADARATAPPSCEQAPIAQPVVIRNWLINQADMALARHEQALRRDEVLADRALCEHRYFALLFHERAHKFDPWASSCAIRRRLAGETHASVQPFLRSAHEHLLQVMVDPILRPSILSAKMPISKPKLPASASIAGMGRQSLVDQVSSGKTLSAKQVEELAYLVCLANSQGEFGPWAARVQSSLPQILVLVSGSPPPSAVATSSAASGLKLFEWMLSALESAGYL